MSLEGWLALVVINTPKGWTPISVQIPATDGRYRACWDTGLNGEYRYAAWSSVEDAQLAERFPEEVLGLKRRLEGWAA